METASKKLLASGVRRDFRGILERMTKCRLYMILPFRRFIPEVLTREPFPPTDLLSWLV